MAFLIGLAACGGGAEPEPIPDDDPLARRDRGGRGGSAQAATTPAADQGNGDRSAFASYQKVPGDLRPDLTSDSFRADPDGVRNRDPFRSYVVAQPGAPRGMGDDEARDRTEVCDETNSVASDYSLRELTLIGIVLRGTRGYAMFRDGTGIGYIVNRGECVGSEQAIVRRIGSDYVQLQTVEAGQDLAEPGAHQRFIQLRPDEDELPTTEEIE